MDYGCGIIKGRGSALAASLAIEVIGFKQIILGSTG